MYKKYLIAVTMFVGLAALFYFAARNNNDRAVNPSPHIAFYKVVRAVRAIEEGHVFKPNDLEEQMLPETEVPSKAIDTKDLAIGRAARNSIPKGGIVCVTELKPFPPGFEGYEKFFKEVGR